jgi:uncharacterized membrane protein YoaK (UPF0700 family)
MISTKPVPTSTIPTLLSLNAGYVDTIGFLALQGLFTAHVTGNFVTLGASLVLGTSGALAKLLALPTFCVVVVLVRLFSQGLPRFNWSVLRTVLTLKVLLLIASAVLGICFGPFGNGDAAPAIITGLTLVSAMAIQNAAHRIHMASFPPTNLMTGTTTQIMIDIADLLRGSKAETLAALRLRLMRMSRAVAAFAFGCGAAALLYAKIGVWAFAVPPAIGAIALLLRMDSF